MTYTCAIRCWSTYRDRIQAVTADNGWRSDRSEKMITLVVGNHAETLGHGKHDITIEKLRREGHRTPLRDPMTMKRSNRSRLKPVIAGGRRRTPTTIRRACYPACGLVVVGRGCFDH
jgi:hypothetical protein